jgi:integrase
MWVFMFRDGEQHRSVNLGTIEKYTTKASAEKAANKIRKDINGRREHVYVRDLLDKYEREDLPAREVTSATYRSFIKRIREKYGDVRLDVLAKDLMGLEQWVNSLQTYPTKNKPAREMSKKSKIHFKAFIHRLFERAIFWNMLDLQRNPVGLISVKGRGGRVKPLVIVTVEQYLKILDDPELPEHTKVMVQIAMCMGLRASEILGLQWIDINFEESTIHVCRSVVGTKEEDVKTLGSAQTIPAHPELMEALRAWKETPSIKGWVFGSPLTGRPFWRGTMHQDYLTPAGDRAGVSGLGWHSFRHTYRTMLRESGEPMEVQQKLMRHADIRTTMDYGEQSMIEERRKANVLIFEKVRKSA